MKIHYFSTTLIPSDGWFDTGRKISIHIWTRDVMNTVFDIHFLHWQSHGGFEAAVLLNDFQGKSNFAAICGVPQHTGVIARVIEEGGPEPEHIFLLTDAILWEAEVNGFLQVPILPGPVPDQGKARGMSSAVVVLQEVFKEGTLDASWLIFKHLDLSHGIQTPVITAF